VLAAGVLIAGAASVAPAAAAELITHANARTCSTARPSAAPCGGQQRRLGAVGEWSVMPCW
jgi:hypothetical protein